MTETVVTIERGTQPKTATTSTGQQGQGLGWIKLNTGYFQSLPGLLKIVQLILGILCMSLASPAYIGASHYFLFVAVTSFIATLLWTFAYFLGVREGLNLAINWILTELLNTGIVTLLYFIAFIVQLARWSGISGYGYASNIAAGVFGLFNTLAYAAGAYLLYMEHKSGSTQ